ncbi:hypothetical protein PEC302107_40430 [Pectobacterium araliae]|nr:hypothetical protein PEC302107_40430 [Pectobacterium carotovorum subsp. carotovorum]
MQSYLEHNFPELIMQLEQKLRAGELNPRQQGCMHTALQRLDL